jgi:hypothetical protein
MEQAMTTKASDGPYIIELYGALPSVVALLALGIARSEDLTFWLKVVAVLLLGLGAFACTRSLSLLVVGAVVLLEKAYFHHPLTSYLGAIGLAFGLIAKARPHRQAALFRAMLLVCGLGLGPTLNPDVAIALYRLQSAVAAASLLYPIGAFRPVLLLSNPIAALSGNQPDNQHRFDVMCVAFLSFGGLSWAYATEEHHAAAAAFLCVVSTVLALPLVLTGLGLEGAPPGALASIRVLLKELEEDVNIKTNQLAALTKERKQQRQEIEKELSTKWRRSEQALLAKKRQAETEILEAKRRQNQQLRISYYSQPWDSLVYNLCDKPSVTVPGGETLCTTDHLLIGLRRVPSQEGDENIEPVFMHRDILRDHIHILGGTGSGKTSLGITPLAVQLIRSPKKAPLIVLDLKGEASLFHTLRAEAERNNQEFLFFSLESNKPTYRFNPFVGIKQYGGTRNEQAQPLLDALGLNHGEGYGRAFFTRLHRQRLLEALGRNPNIHSFAQLKEALAQVPGTKPSRRPVSVNSQKDELVAAIEGVADYPQLFTTEEEELRGDGIIRFDRVFEQNQVVYFWLPAPTQSISVREIGKLVLYNLFFSALKRKNAGQLKQAYLIIDEFQRLIGENLSLFLEQSRSYGIGLTLANQNIDQLNNHDAKLWPLVQSNVRASLHFGSGDPKEIELLSKASGEAIGYLEAFARGQSTGSSQTKSRSTSTGETNTESYGRSDSFGETSAISENASSGTTYTDGHQSGVSTSSGMSEANSSSVSSGEARSTSKGISVEQTTTEYVRPLYRPQDVAAVFNRQGHFFYWVRRAVPPLVDFNGKPIEASGIYAISKELHERRDSAPWPKLPYAGDKSLLSGEAYKASSTVTEEVMVNQVLSALKES